MIQVENFLYFCDMNTKTNIKTFAGKPVEYKNKINKLDSLTWITFDALRDGPLRGTKKEAELFEVMTAKGIRKSCMKLVKKGFANVNDGKFTISKLGIQQIIGLKKSKAKPKK
jgi:hypothetical protein